MNKVDFYIKAATRDNTRRSYRSAVEHFETEWGGFLPATSDSVVRYLSDYAATLAISTLRQRIAALSQWHLDQGMPDPTKSPIVKKVLRGIRATHPSQIKQARPLQLEQLEQLDTWLSEQIAMAITKRDRTNLLKCLRNRALVLIGFWRGFRSDELSHLNIENITVVPNEGMRLYLPFSKTDRENRGTTYNAPSLSRLCPVSAYMEWINVSKLTSGPLFPGIDRWGNISRQAMHPTSFIQLLRDLLRKANLANPDSYSSHSLRRGFATWARANNWDLRELMNHVGWKDMRSAIQYIDYQDPFEQHTIEASLKKLA